ncbi:bifunctional DNA-binding transcriptional regulator/O6-methylguanine-DNA methyltransferase Ada [Edaphovirga cremea]|uniref:bifunctional DNA-binding transcriptional regulator/O6-methylguanine-DNA methyltransferase Ada n=1 Tax=Edaphovirga cremea TaxID=2267246 RepID=UPI000DEEF48B|nr:bifunctional DNA-binding transcriptional regulator/O6-methylguanine-DNA methyltransferase Ada [Edaphovirga cremea]
MKTIETKNSNPSTDEMRWQAIVTRDKKSEGHFIYAVKTTGIYCSPACPSRQPKRENVQFFNDAAEAEAAGFRPCKRCRQGLTSLADRHAAQIASVCRYIEQAEETPTLNELAKYAGMSTFHFHRLFKSITGLTPKGYADAHRSQRVREHLSQDTSVTEAIFDAGYHSNGRFYEKSNAMLGMTPTAFRTGGQGMKIYFAVGLCSLGDILVAQSERGICAILLGDEPQKLLQDLQDKFPKAELVGGDKAFEQRMAQVVGFIEAPDTGLDLPLDIRGTAFQQRVWQALCDIPVGSTVSYAVIAQKIGAPKAVRAVAGACAANMLAVAIPCHRVVRNDGALSGYRWGVERKRALLDKEAKA